MSAISTIRDELSNGSFSKNVKTIGKSLLPLFEKELDVLAYQRARRQLNDLGNSLTDNEKKAVIGCALFMLKKRHDTTTPIAPYHDEHVITDHAFCTALRRYCGTDLLTEKDAILRLAHERGWPYAQKGGKIVTFYPQGTP